MDDEERLNKLHTIAKRALTAVDKMKSEEYNDVIIAEEVYSISGLTKELEEDLDLN